VVLQFLNDLRNGYQFRKICWKYPVRPLAGTEDSNESHFFVGDEGFTLNRNILRPFGGSNLNVKKRVYNYRLCRARRYVECAFGILSNKWRIFQRPLNVSPDFAVDIVKVCVVLHNFVRERDGYKFQDALTVLKMLFHLLRKLRLSLRCFSLNSQIFKSTLIPNVT
jgi:hypothetical protein